MDLCSGWGVAVVVGGCFQVPQRPSAAPPSPAMPRPGSISQSPAEVSGRVGTTAAGGRSRGGTPSWLTVAPPEGEGGGEMRGVKIGGR